MLTMRMIRDIMKERAKSEEVKSLLYLLSYLKNMRNWLRLWLSCFPESSSVHPILLRCLGGLSWRYDCCGCG